MPNIPPHVQNAVCGLMPIAFDPHVRKKPKIPSLRSPRLPCWLIIIFMMISYVTAISSRSDCSSRLSDGLSKDMTAERAKIFVI